MTYCKSLPCKLLLLTALELGALCFPSVAFPLELTPFYTFNQSPLVQIFGLPPADNATVVPAGRISALLELDTASNFAVDEDVRDQITLDGETYRTTLALRYGTGRGFEVGLDIPFVARSGGFLDNAIEAWHNFFDISQAGRELVPHNRLVFRYTRDGVDRLDHENPDAGLGDIRLTGAAQLYGGKAGDPLSAALRASLKLPNGSSRRLFGSGSTDFALWITAANDFRLTASRLTVFGAAGGMAMTKGDVLSDLQRQLVGFATLGLGWSPSPWLGFKAQLNGHTPFYRNSALKEFNVSSVQTVFGGTVAFTGSTSLDIGFSEDILVIATSPDFGINLALRTMF